MSWTKWFGIPSQEELTKTVIAEIDKQILEPLLARVDKRIADAKKDVTDSVTAKVSGIERKIEEGFDGIKDATIEQASMIKKQATKKVEKEMEAGYKKILNVFK
jgi:hypothetical protein